MNLAKYCYISWDQKFFGQGWQLIQLLPSLTTHVEIANEVCALLNFFPYNEKSTNEYGNKCTGFQKFMAFETVDRSELYPNQPGSAWLARIGACTLGLHIESNEILSMHWNMHLQNIVK